MSNIAANSAANAATQVVNSPISNAGVSHAGALNTQKDTKTPSTDPKFGDVLNKIQAQYGARPEKPREIKKTLGKDDFLRIMITQMKNQDPTSPFKPEQMAAEMAQFASVEQLQNVNQNLGKMANQNQPLERMAMTNLIGKMVTVDRERFQHVQGSNEVLSFNLQRPASNVKMAVVADTGETVLEKELGPQKAGEGSMTWDGNKTNNLPAKAGTYQLKVVALDEQGRKMETDPQRTARVIGVSFEGTEPAILVGDAKHHEKITMKNIIRIETEESAAMSAQQAKTPSNFIAFQKGVGSSNLNADQPMNAEVQAALDKFKAEAAKTAEQPQGAAPASAPAIHQDREKGFPNGLHDSEQAPSMNPNIMRGGESK